MRCFNPNCGQKGLGIFCSKCGAECKPVQTVSCPVVKEEGNVCGFELQPMFKTCPICSTEINHQLFTGHICSSYISEDKFCSNCGHHLEDETEHEEIVECSNPKCGQEGLDIFCAKCGWERKPNQTVSCPGEAEEGSICGFTLQSEFKVCPICSTEINHQIFYQHTCTAEMAEGKYCSKCGNNLNKGKTHGEMEGDTETLAESEKESTEDDKNSGVGALIKEEELPMTSPENKESKTDKYTSSEISVTVGQQYISNQSEVQVTVFNGDSLSKNSDDSDESIYESADEYLDLDLPIPLQNSSKSCSNVESSDNMSHPNQSEQAIVVKENAQREDEYDNLNCSHDLENRNESQSDLTGKPKVDTLRLEKGFNESLVETMTDNDPQQERIQTEDIVSLPNDSDTTTKQPNDNTVISMTGDDNSSTSDGEPREVYENDLSEIETPAEPDVDYVHLSNVTTDDNENDKRQELLSTRKDSIGPQNSVSGAEGEPQPEPPRNQGTSVDTGRTDDSTAAERNKPSQQTNGKRNGSKRSTLGKNKSIDMKNRNAEGKHKSDRSLMTELSLTEQPIHVIFHVIISAHTYFDAAKHQLCLLLKEPNGEWVSTKRVCEHKRINPNNGASEYEYDMHFPMKNVTSGSNIQYKYCIVKLHKQGEVEFENYIKQGQYDEKAVRTVGIPATYHTQDVWHQYDGVVERKHTTMKTMKELFHLENAVSLQDNAMESIDCFCYSIALSTFLSVDELLQMLGHLFNGMRRTYHYDNMCWYNDYPTFRIKVFDRMVKTLLFKYVSASNIHDTDETNKEKEKRIMEAVALVILSESYNIPEGNMDLSKICQCLIIKATDEDNECHELAVLEQCSDTHRSQFLKCLVRFVGYLNRKSTDPSWLFLMPWIHMLSGLCKPFETPSVDIGHEEQIPRWWGIAGVDTGSLYTFISKTETWEIPLLEMLRLLSPTFTMDYYLPRTLIACLKLEELPTLLKQRQIPLEVLMANIIFWIKRHRNIRNKDISMTIYEVLESILQRLECYEGGNANEQELVHTTSRQLLERTVAYVSDVQLVITATLIRLRCLSLRGNQDDRGIDEEVKATLELESKWWRQVEMKWKQDVTKFFTDWNKLYLPDNEELNVIRDSWNNGITDLLNAMLHRQTKPRTRDTMPMFIEFYCRHSSDFHMLMQDSLSKIAFMAIEDGYMLDQTTWRKDGQTKYGILLSKFLTETWKKYSPRNERVPDIVFLIEWAPFSQYYKILREDKGKTKLLTEGCSMTFSQSLEKLDTFLDELIEGTVHVDKLEMIVGKEKQFVQFAKHSHIDHTGNHLLTVLKMRYKEVDAFRKQMEQVRTMIQFSGQLTNVDKTDAMEVLKRFPNLDGHAVNEFCKPTLVQNDDVVDVIFPNLTAFKLHEVVQDILPSLSKFDASKVFWDMWKQSCKEKNKRVRTSLTLDQVVIEVIQPVKQRWEDFLTEVQSGDVTFECFQDVIGSIYNDNYVAMESELKNMKVPEKIITTRITQLQNYRRLSTCIEGANVIKDMTRVYDLQGGNFDDIYRIADESGTGDQKMASLDENFMDTCRELENMSPIRKACLKTFVDCHALVEWLNSSMKQEGQKELKVFIDLAMMSAGDEPLNVAKVQCLHAAVTGYAPLIFELDEVTTSTQLLDRCLLVWNQLTDNPELPTQLADTWRNQPWFEDVKKAHGAVEVTSLAQAQTINGQGVYMIGLDDDHFNGDTLEIGDVVTLNVYSQKAAEKERSYTFSDIQDLQSRLMLVAGIDDSDVGRFTNIFDSVTRLTHIYMKLNSAGCILFNDWKAELFCEKGKKVCANMRFGKATSAPALKGRIDEEDTSENKEDVQQITAAIARFMENCLKQWMEYIQDKRKEYLYLNYYTVPQLVILQKELVKYSTDGRTTDKLYTLLESVKENCTPGDLQATMRDTFIEIERRKKNADKTLEQIKEQQDKQNAFIAELVKAGFSENLVLAYLEQAVDSPDQGFDKKRAYTWCMKHESEQPALAKRRTDDGDNLSVEALIRKAIGENKDGIGSEDLINRLEGLWKQFLESVSLNIKDYLSLEHLGLMLDILSKRSQVCIERTMPPCFKEGEPNLIICQSEDVLNSTLSIYIFDESQPLPLPDEVLMCTAHTTEDEVVTFWRRSMFDNSKKIRCLISPDMLDFDVTENAERYLEEYMREARSGNTYRLFVICGSDNENKSSIVSTLGKYKRQCLPSSAETLQQYIQTHLTNQSNLQQTSVVVVKSSRAGIGKTLFKIRNEEEMTERHKLNPKVIMEAVTIPLQEKVINIQYVIKKLLEHTVPPQTETSRIFHIDMYHEVQEGVDYFLFNLLILGCLVHKTGYVWKRSYSDLYIIETMPIMDNKHNTNYVHTVFNILPNIVCRSPNESLNVYAEQPPNDFKDNDQLFDVKHFESDVFQRSFQYLYRLDRDMKFKDIEPKNPMGTQKVCLETLLKHCGTEDPSWAELHNFVLFLNTQLISFETNIFVTSADLPGFERFVLKCLIQMSRDFSTRSLNMNETPPPGSLEGHGQHVSDKESEGNDASENELEKYQMRRKWESSPHPYLFFNADGETFSFLGFLLDPKTCNLIDHTTGEVLEENIMSQYLLQILLQNGVPIMEDFDSLNRMDKICRLRRVMGVEEVHDPDVSYELTTDNVKKMLAIYMRFRCDIPVIVMGETGCGKTRLIQFMCALQAPAGKEVNNMILVKVHGGTTNADLIRHVLKAEKTAAENKAKFGDNIFTVLFFDEANTTESVGLIKEIMCDKSIEGRKLELCQNLKIVAACNPYRKHSEEMIKRLEQAGLGYHVHSDNVSDKLGHVPMRRLVYRVQPLPQSLQPFVWDFGQLNTEVETLYIRQMVKRYINDDKLPDLENLKEVISDILTASQEFMRKQQDECSFVSLRDVDRVLTVMSWFYTRCEDDRTLYDAMDMGGDDEDTSEDDDVKTTEDDEDDDDVCLTDVQYTKDITRSLVLAIGVCYHASLKSRSEYRDYIANEFKSPFDLPGGADQIAKEIERCQDIFLQNVNLEENIARNMALKENVFMMIVCIELRIPLFLVGKPGSSKSLAKTIVSDAMAGSSARNDLFKNFKKTHMVSFQCSPISTADGIVGTFKQCANFQKDQNLDTFVSVVVLDEVGLAEDSPKMPLKTLHPLLEDGCQSDESIEEYKKVAFIGISNWALDPAKMNRGILVQRAVPQLSELETTAIGICQSTEGLAHWMDGFIQPLSESYLEVFDKATKQMREFFGLRDFYSLVKMVYSFVRHHDRRPTWFEVKHAILRNFGGLETLQAEQIFKKHLETTHMFNLKAEPGPTDPDCSSQGLIEACLFDKYNLQSVSRYLLLISENYGSLSFILKLIQSEENRIRPITIFGSSFRRDQEYTQVCRNINEIKRCMETGQTVVLLNLENLYESLYDTLNQYYECYGGERYVDLGLGTHRVKCPVHKQFRLIVVAEKKTVYRLFPIPLINRLEKHFFSINTMLSKDDQCIVEDMRIWAKGFALRKGNRCNIRTEVGDVFIGFNDDTCPAVVLHAKQNEGNDKERILRKAKKTLLCTATPESVVTLAQSNLAIAETEELQTWYFQEQAHDSFLQYLEFMIQEKQCMQLRTQVTTHSKLMAKVHEHDIASATRIPVKNVLIVETLSLFETEQQFSSKIRRHIENAEDEPSLMVIQCESGDTNANLVACARYSIMDTLEHMADSLTSPIHIVFVLQLPRVSGGIFTGFQCGIWRSVHIDELHIENKQEPNINDLQGKTVAELFFETADHLDTAQAQAAHAQLDRFEGHELPDVFEDATSTRKQPDMTGLIRICVPAAMSMVKEDVSSKSRETRRVELVLKFLHGSTDQGLETSFIKGVSHMIATIMKEKEPLAVDPHHWMIRDAAALDLIGKIGTFRRSCLKILESKISPILAGIICFLDTNQNLELLAKSEDDWKQMLWISVLNTPSAVDLQLKYFQSPTGERDLREFVVKSTGHRGRPFVSQMPFSWLMIEKINQILCDSDKTNADDTVGYENDRFEAIFIASHIGQCMQGVVSDVETLIGTYIHDFVETMYHSRTKKELMLVCHFVKTDMTDKTKEVGIVGSMIQVHRSFEDISSHLNYFNALNMLWPECSDSMTERINTQTQQAINDEDMVLVEHNAFSVHALLLTLDTLELSIDDLENGNTRSNWLTKIHQYRPVVERILSLNDPRQERVAEEIKPFVVKASSLWDRIMVIRLFLEHVASPSTEVPSKHLLTLWEVLGSETNLKRKESIIAIEEFLRVFNTATMKTCLGKILNCTECENTLECAPTFLPCKDVLCEKCFRKLRADKSTTCPNCNEEFEEGWEPETLDENKDQVQKFLDYQKRCNSFFMDVVSQLCFADNGTPSEEVLKMLLQYITRKEKGKQFTKDLTIFDTGIDRNPVLRSFLLQRMLRSSVDIVEPILDEYLTNFREHVLNPDNEDDGERQLIELSLLVIQCFEDVEIERLHTVNTVKNVKRMLRYAENTISGVEHSYLVTLRALAQSRVGILHIADYIAKCFLSSTEHVKLPATLNQMLGYAKSICERFEWPRKFLVKYLCRQYSFDVYHRIITADVGLEWIELPEQEAVKFPDRFIVCGTNYTDIRTSLQLVVSSNDISHLNRKIKELGAQGGQTESDFLLAVYKVVTDSTDGEITPTTRQEIADFIQNQAWKSKDVALHLLQSPAHGTGILRDIQCLVTHFEVVMATRERRGNILKPLLSLMTGVAAITDVFIPTMPQDDLDDIDVDTLIQGLKGQNNTVKVYRCPNGHPYCITECGQAVAAGICECGAPIGGQATHVLMDDNTADDGMAKIQTGHILGQPESRGEQPIGVRNMTASGSTCLRLLIHMAMFVGSKRDAQRMMAAISPPIQPDGLEQFLVGHIEKDINQLCNCFGKGSDDVLLFMHILVKQLGELNIKEIHITIEDCKLLTKDSRRVWEDTFCNEVLFGQLRSMNILLDENNKALANDDQLESKLLRLVHETDDDRFDDNPNELYKAPRVWRYRTTISVEHLRQELDNKLGAAQTGQFTVLQTFLREEPHLRSIQYIPSILLLQRALNQRFYRKIDKTEADKMLVKQLIREEIAGPETSKYVHEFFKAWDMVRETLKHHVCRTKHGRKRMPLDLCDQSMSTESPISVLMLTNDGQGLCTFALLEYLFKKQNEVLDVYQKSMDRHAMPSVVPKNVTPTHLISYDTEQDLQPLILANCQYSLEVGHGTKIDYDFAGLERQLIDRLLAPKSIVDYQTHLKTDHMVFRTEVTTASVFSKLDKKIPQIPIDDTMKAHIFAEIRSLPEMCKCLDQLDITIGFLTSTGGKPDDKLFNYMNTSLQLNVAEFASQKIRQTCELQHIRSLWLLLSLQKSRRLVDHNQTAQSIFETLKDDYFHELSEGLQDTFDDYLESLAIEKLQLLVEKLHQYIVLFVTSLENINNEDDMNIVDKSLVQWFENYIEEDVDLPLQGFPPDILNKHVLFTWIAVHKAAKERSAAHKFQRI